MDPEVTHIGVFDMQVCVPADWTDDQAEEFARTEVLCGTTNGWRMRHTEDYDAAAVQTDKAEPIERVPCSDRAGFVHIMLDA